ncbi:SDR family NAD(P)-dependent oxidoreductase [Lentzea alba]|uniref:SDR family NAD(P)-dependent oxidoreductase n=1 Tax=Lentzea alba TaxID=2714351 RepID=UPI0039BFEA2E
MRYTLPALFAESVITRKDAAAVFIDGHYRSWEDWRGDSTALARGLQELGVRKGDVVAVHLPNCWDLLTLHVAIAEIGAVMLPLHAKLGVADVRSLIDRAGASVVVVPANLAERTGAEFARSLLAECPSLRHSLLSGSTAVSEVDGSAHDVPNSVQALYDRWRGKEPLQVAVMPDDHFMYLPSSGTTSLQPKICVHTHNSLLSNAAQIATDGQLVDADEIISASPLTHLYGLLSVHISLITGSTQALLPHWDVDSFFRLVRDARPTVLFTVPAQAWDILSRLGSGDDAAELGLREIRLSGAVVPDQLAAAVRRHTGARVVVHWGMSELGGGLFTRPGDPVGEVFCGVGHPVTGSQVRVVGNDGATCAPGEEGELHFRGPSVFTGYLGAPELTRAALSEDGWLRTGDQATVRDDGVVVYLGRSTDLINVGGVKFSATEIETLLADLPVLRQVAVLGRPDERIGEYPCVVVSTRDGGTVSLAEITNHLAAKGVAEYKMPAELIILPDLPATPTGKITKRRLAARLDEETGRPEISWAAQLRALDAAERFEQALRLVRAHVQEVVGNRTPIEPDEVFVDHGMHSLTAVRLCRALAATTALPVPTTAVFDLPTPRQLAGHLVELATRRVSAPVNTQQASTSDSDDPIVVVGIGCRAPGGVTSADELWDLLAEGRDAIGEFPVDRGWDLTTPVGYRRLGGFIEDATSFDAAFFGISPREAAAMDPQQRVLLETAWQAIEHAMIVPASLRDSQTGVFIGMMTMDYESREVEQTGGLATTGNASSVASGRLSYLLGLRGPALTIDTACSSSLVAVHLAVQSLRSGECSLAIAGGVTIMSTPRTFTEFSRQQIISSNGRCRSFADSADGTGWSEACGVIVLERLSDARRAGHRVLGLIRGSAVNQDGRSNGLSAPNGPAQQQVMTRALTTAGITAGEVDMLEAHGSATSLGDPIEAQAVIATYGGERDTPMLLGSVKSNIGHTQAAAGVLGMIKAILSVQHAAVPETLHVDEPTSHVDWGLRTVRPATALTPWPSSGRPRRAAVSSFGISGTNAHLIVEEAPAEPLPATVADVRTTPAVVPVVLSAASPSALRSAAARLADRIGDDLALVDMAASLISTRTVFAHRAVVVASDHATLTSELHAVAAGAHETTSAGQLSGAARVVFVFPGHGAQWAGMGRELFGTAPVFTAAMTECDQALREFVDWSLLDVLDDEEALSRPDIVQPALFSVMYSLARLWESVGVVPDAVVGHSQGELAAACFAGALSLRDALYVVVRRGVRCAALRPGLLLHVPITDGLKEQLSNWPGVTVAAENGPSSVILTGGTDSIMGLGRWYEENGVRARVLRDSFPSHSPIVEAVREALLTDLSGLDSRDAVVPWYSTVTGERMSGSDADAEYWYSNLRQPVRFGATVAALSADGFTHFIEVSPHPVLIPALTGALPGTSTAVGTLRRDDGSARRFLLSAAEGFVRGLSVDWARWFDGCAPRRIDLPTYPFDRTRYWLSAPVRHEVSGLGQESVDHPIIKTLIEDPEGDTAVFTGQISVTELPWLADHRVHGAVVVPGVALLELLCLAGDRFGCGRVAEALVESPVVVPDDMAVHVQIRVGDEQDGRRVCTIHTRAEGDRTWARNVTGELDSEQAPLDFTLMPWPPRGARTVNPAEVYGLLGDAGVALGPAFRGLRTLHRRGPELFAEVVLAAGHGGEATAFRLHPALLDCALHPGALLGDHSGGPQVPYAWRGVSWPATRASVLRVRLRQAGTSGTFTIRVTDENDVPVAQFDSFSVRALRTTPATSAGAVADSLFRLDWVVASGALSPTPGWETLDLRGEQDLHGVLLRTLSALRRADTGLLVVTGGAVVTRLGEASDPVQAAVWGLVRSAQEERPGSVVLIDGDSSFSSAMDLPTAEAELAVRDGKLLVPRLTRQGPVQASVSLPSDGTVLITGGTGTLGSLLATHLVEQHGVRRLLLLSRSGPQAPGAEALRENLRQRGAIVDIVACDVSNRTELSVAISEIPAEHPLTCVVHAAGMRQDGVFTALDAESLDVVLAAKAVGAQHLHDLTSTHPLAAFVLFSSVAGLLGSQGQANYGAANAYLDALAELRRAQGLPSVSIAWGLWRTDSALTATMTEADRERIRRRGIEALSDDEALSLFDAAIGAGPPVLAAMRVNLLQLQQISPRAVWHGILAPRDRRSARAGGYNTVPASALLDVLAALDEAGRMPVVENLVRTQAAALLGHTDPSDVDLDRNFIELGFDSLSEVELRERLVKTTGVKLAIEAVAGSTTLANLARLLHGSLVERLASYQHPVA